MSDLNQAGEVKLKRELGIPLLICFGLAYLAPTVVFNYYGIWTVSTEQGGTNGMYALALAITTVVMSITAFAYTRMVKEFPQAGSAYVYVSKSVQPHVGFMTGWIMLLDYLALPMICYVLIGIYVHLYLPMIPAWLIITFCIVVVWILCILGAKVSSIVDTIIIIMQMAFTFATIFLCISYVTKGGGTGQLLDISGLINPDGISWPSVFKASAILCVSFLGFDAVTSMVEDTKNPDKAMTPAIMGTLLIAGVIFFITAYFLQIAWPNGANEIEDPNSGIYEFYPQIGHAVWADIFFVVDEFASFVCALSAMGATSRMLYGMGHDNILPKNIFGKLSPKFHTPVNNITICSAVCLVGIFFADNLAGAASIISVGAILGFFMVNLSVIMHFYKKRGCREGAKNKIQYLILPILGMGVLLVSFNFVPIPAKIIAAIWFVIGIIYLAIKTKGFKELPPEMKLE